MTTENATGIEEEIDNVGMLQLSTQLNLEALSNKLDVQKGSQVDYAREVQSGAVMLQQQEVSLEARYERMLRLINELPRPQAMRKQAEQLKSQVDKTKAQIDDERAKFLMQPPRVAATPWAEARS